MLMPREMVLRLNGGGERTPDGGVEPPVLVVVVDPGVVTAGVVGVTPVGVPVVAPGVCEVVAVGDVSGEKMPPRAYSDRFKP